MPHIIDDYHLPYVLLYRGFIPLRFWCNDTLRIREYVNWENSAKILKQNDEGERCKNQMCELDIFLN